MVVRRGIGSERQAVLVCGISQIVQNKARLDASALPSGIKLEKVMHVLRHVDHDRNIAALARKACPAATTKNRCAVLSRETDSLDHIVDIARQNDTNRDLPVI